jgi:hypothetical protein
MLASSAQCSLVLPCGKSLAPQVVDISSHDPLHVSSRSEVRIAVLLLINFPIHDRRSMRFSISWACRGRT